MKRVRIFLSKDLLFGFFSLWIVISFTACAGDIANPHGGAKESPTEERRVEMVIVTVAPTPTLMTCTHEPNGPTLKLASKSGIVEGDGFVPGEALNIRLLCTTVEQGRGHGSDGKHFRRADKDGHFEYDGIPHVVRDWESVGVPSGTKVICHLFVRHSKGVACLDAEVRIP